MRNQIPVVLAIFCLIGLINATCPAVSSSMCNVDTLRCCDSQFQNALGLRNCTGAFWDEPQCHRRELEKIYSNGTAGLFTTCSAFSSYYQCLGLSAGNCTSMQFHMGQGMSLGNAIELVSIYKQFGFACGAGLDIFVNQDGCMSSVFAQNSTAIEACRTTFANNLQANWDSRCTYYSEYDGCMQELFKYSCGTEAGWWACEYARQGGRTFLHECAEHCTVIDNFTK